MCQFLHLGDLFQRPLIPIGQQDKRELENMYTGSDGRPGRFTHWLIALLWCEIEEYNGWKVVVFPVTYEKVFWLAPPLFHTMTPSSFEKAWKLSEAIKASSQNDRLTLLFVHPYWDDWAEI